MNLTEDQFQLYLFTRQYPGWMGFSTDQKTKKAVAGLALLGLVEVNRFEQLKAI